MRKLNLKDVIKTARIIKKANLREEIRQTMKNYSDSVKEGIKDFIPVKTGDGEEDMKRYQKELETYSAKLAIAKSEASFAGGIDAVMILIDAAANETVEDAVYDLLAGITEKSKEEISNQSLDALMDDIEKIAKENDFANFMKRVNQLVDL